MSTASAPDSTKTATSAPDGAEKPKEDFDPDSFRMTIGEHLEELRGRLVLSLMGLSVAVIGCLLFSERVMVIFCAPLMKKLVEYGLPPTMNYVELTDPFMTYLKVTMIVAASIAGPWMIYQIWQFVAAGLYPNERKVITRYIPLSVTLFLLGLVFVYFVVLPLSIGFFLRFSAGMAKSPLPTAHTDAGPFTPRNIPILNGNPANPQPGDIWVDREQNSLRVAIGSADGKAMQIRSIFFAPDSMLAPIITIGDYISLVITFMLTFGIAFQLPLVMLAVVSIGVVEVEFLKTKRKIVFFGMTVASAFLAPGDIVTTMLALLIPLIILYEFGLLLIRFASYRKAKAAAAEEKREQAEREAEARKKPK